MTTAATLAVLLLAVAGLALAIGAAAAVVYAVRWHLTSSTKDRNP